MASTVESNNVVRLVISKLEGNFVAEGKKTCQSCLRSKSLPCKQVVEVATASAIEWESTIIIRIYDILMEEYTVFSTSLSSSSSSLPSDNYSSLSCMSKVITIPRFLQLLLLLTEPHKQQHSQERSDISLPTEQINKMIGTLLDRWSKGLCSFIQQEWKENHSKYNTTDEDDDDNDESNNYNPMTGDATNNLDPRPVFCYAYTSLVRMNKYVKSRGQLIVPLWKSLCELAGILVELDGDVDDENNKHCWQKCIPSNLLPNAIGILSDFLHEGKERLETSAVLHLIRKASSSDTDTIHQNIVSANIFQGKLVGFMATKLSCLLRVYFVLNKDVTGFDENKEMLERAWRSLLVLSGIASAIQLLLPTKYRSDENSQEDFTMLKVFCELHMKATLGFNHIIFLSNASRQILIPALENLLMNVALDTASKSSKNDGRDPDIVRVGEIGYAFGRVSLLQSILATADANVPENAEPLLSAVEDLHSISIPYSYGANVLALRNNNGGHNNGILIWKSLQTMLQVLLALESSPAFEDPSKRSQFQHLLIKWLGGTSASGMKYQHPMSRELVVSLLHAYILSSEKTTSSTKFVLLLVKLLLDARTDLSLRRNVASLLTRLQASSDSKIYQFVRRLVEQEFTRWLGDVTVNSKSKKRKRSEGNSQVSQCLVDPKHIRVILLAVKGHGMSESCTVFPPVVKQAFERLHAQCTRGGGNNEQALIARAESTSMVLAFVERCILMGSIQCLDFFSQQVGIDLFEFLSPIFATLTSIFVSNNDDVAFNKNALLRSAAMRLSVTASNIFGGKDVYQKTLGKVSNLVNKSTLAQPFSLNSARAVATLRYDALAVLGSIGGVIPDTCSDMILQV